MNSYKNILIIQTAFLGDVILLTPLIRAVKRLYPQANIDALVVPQSQGVLENNPHLRDVLTFDKRRNKWRAFWQTLRRLRAAKYDLAISPHSSVTTAWLMVLAGIPVRVGFDRWHAARYLTHRVPHYDDRSWHKVQKNLHLLTALSEPLRQALSPEAEPVEADGPLRQAQGTDTEPCPPRLVGGEADRSLRSRQVGTGRAQETELTDLQTELFPTQQDEAWAENKLAGFSSSEKPLIALAPGSVWNTKRWPKEHYIALSKKLCEQGYALVFIGGPDERPLCAEIIEQSGCQALNVASEASILQSAALIGRCDLMICNDSGALHIANAMQTDVFAFFGPTVPSIGYFPFRPNDVVFEREMDCRPCGSHGGNVCPLKHHECMTLITPEEVFAKVEQKFGKK
ncbi:MAG TPA: glycosyltransferase family 9 protein [Caldithrix abyssi]|uniref:Glycosyltransferase family 9 protein n=1 Tax=Caldithrix abyssi TaxID=187145 RepID=A0A7V4TYA4_CALAY|nr:glycosyltransferase family 9 protein [Caldithrix abyssi]